MSDGRQELIRKDFYSVADTPEGRRVLGNILLCARYSELSYDPNSPTNTAFAEGARSIGLALASLLGSTRTYECMNAFEKFDAQFNKGDDSYGG